jgi:hypothetical protein
MTSWVLTLRHIRVLGRHTCQPLPQFVGEVCSAAEDPHQRAQVRRLELGTIGQLVGHRRYEIHMRHFISATTITKQIRQLWVSRITQGWQLVQTLVSARAQNPRPTVVTAPE